MNNKTYSRDGLTVTELEAFTLLTSSKLALIKFEVIVNGKKRIDVLDANNEFQNKMIDFLSSPSNGKNRAKTYYSMIK